VHHIKYGVNPTLFNMLGDKADEGVIQLDDL